MAKKSLVIIPDDPSKGVPIIKPGKVFQALYKGDTSSVAQAFISIFVYFENHQYKAYSADDISNINDIVSTLFAVIIDPKFKPNKSDVKILIGCGHVLSNIVATSDYRTTDAALKHVLRQKNNYFQTLFLCNARNEFRMNPESLFGIDDELASIWYNTYALTNSAPSKLVQTNLFNHIKEMDERWVAPNPRISTLYFTCTYLNPNEDKRVKSIINKSCKEKYNIVVKNNPDPRKIAIVSAKWKRNHAVYKSAGPLVGQLKGEFDLTLVHIGEKLSPDAMVEGFEEVLSARFIDRKLSLPEKLTDNKFQLIYYPDIGMNDESVWMSNVRLAPIQAMGYGHPSTSGDSEIDYLIGSLDTELNAAECYSEKMVLIPGLAQSPVWPSYERKHNWVKNEVVKINCVWGPDKYNHTLLRGLAEINQRAKVKHEFHFYPSPGVNRYAGLWPMKREIGQVVPNAVVHSSSEYYEYMEKAETGDFSINSYPFGGYNTAIESLFLGLPIVTLEGTRFYNRACSYLLREIGMGELSSNDPDGFVDIAVKMIDDEEYRTEMRRRLAAMDLRKKLFTSDTYFLQAIKHIIENHPLETNPTIIGESNDWDSRVI